MGVIPSNSLVAKFKRWFNGNQEIINEHCKNGVPGITEVYILFKHLDNRSIVIMDHEFNQISGIKEVVIQKEIMKLIKKTVPLNEKNAGSFQSNLKSIIDKNLDEFIENGIKDAMEDSHFNFDIFNALFEDDSDSIENVTIDNTTIIIGIPSEPKKVLEYQNALLQSPPKSDLYEGVFYFKEFNMISYISGGTHRLAALNLYLRQNNKPFAFDGKKMRSVSIDTKMLYQYRVDKTKKTLYVLSPYKSESVIKKITLTPLLYDLITTLQIYYFGKARLISDDEITKYESLWKQRDKSEIEMASE